MTVSFETIILIIVPLFSLLLINFVNYVNVYYFHVFWRPKVLHNDQCYISLLDFSCYLFWISMSKGECVRVSGE